MVVDEWNISKMLVWMIATKMTEQEINKGVEMSEQEVLSRRLETGTGKKKEIPDHHQGTEIQHHHVMIMQLILVILLYETKIRILRS